MEFIFALLLAFAAAPEAPSEPTVVVTAPQNITQVDPALVQAMMIDYGFPATLDTSNPVDIMIEAYVEETVFVVLFYGCAEGTGCTGAEFATSYDFPQGVDPAHLNAWNRDVRFGAAYLDEHDDPVLTMDVNFAADGIGQGNFEDWLGLWEYLVFDFEAHLDDAPPSPDKRDFVDAASEGMVYEIGLKGLADATIPYITCSMSGMCR